MRKSEIFESFIKIAQERGLVSKDAPEKAIKQLSKTHRHDSLSAEDIGKLYNVKIDRPEGMDYDRNIAEDAHPDSLVISPSYDKINGLIENINERQNIILNIVNKPNNGALTGHKYAEKDLVLNLVRLAEDLDNKNKKELMALADACLNQVSKPLKKEAALPLAIIIAVPVLLGALWAQQHLPFTNEGFQANSQKLIAEIDDLLEANSDWGVGYKYTPEFIQEMQVFKSELIDLGNTVNQSIGVINQLEKPKAAKELIEISQKPESTTVTESYKALRAKIANLTPKIKKVMENFASEDYKARQIVEKGALTSLVDKTQILHGGKGLVADDFDDVKRALTPFRASLIEIIKVLRGANSIEQKSKQELQQAAAEFQSEYGIDAPAPAPTPQAPGAKPSPETADIQKQVTELAKQVPSVGGLFG